MARAPRIEPDGHKAAASDRRNLDEAARLRDDKARRLTIEFGTPIPHRERRAVVKDGLDDAVGEDAFGLAERGGFVDVERPNQLNVLPQRGVDRGFRIPTATVPRTR